MKWTADQLRVEIIDDETAARLRQMTPAQRLASAHAMWRYAHTRLDALLRRQHPDWTEAQLRAEKRRRLLGSD
jgi:hypothetical protein